jgi:hypothetical protein
MAGYKGYSMSNNAVLAYDNGEKPLSKWTKKVILEEINANNIKLQCDIALLKKLPIEDLRRFCLIWTSWHHTSNHFNKTDFYSLDVDGIEDLTNEDLQGFLNEVALNKAQKPKVVEETWKCAFLEWGGTRRHPTSKEIIEVGIVKGDWFYRKDGSKKKVSANGFRFIEKIEN